MTALSVDRYVQLLLLSRSTMTVSTSLTKFPHGRSASIGRRENAQIRIVDMPMLVTKMPMLVTKIVQAQQTVQKFLLVLMGHPATGSRRAVADISIQGWVSRGPITPVKMGIHDRKFHSRSVVHNRKFVRGRSVVNDRQSVLDRKFGSHRIVERMAGTSSRSGLPAGSTADVKESPTARGFTPFRIFPCSEEGDRL